MAGRRNRQRLVEPKRTGRERHACPFSAPTQTSGCRASVSPPGSSCASVVRMRSTSERANLALRSIVWSDCSITLTRGYSCAKRCITRGTCGYMMSCGTPMLISPSKAGLVIRPQASSLSASRRRA